MLISKKTSGRFGFTEWFCFFWNISQMSFYPEQLYKMVLFFSFSEKWQAWTTFRNTTKWFWTYFWIGPQVGVGFTKCFFAKNNEHIYKMVCSFFLLNANSLIHRLLSLTEWLQNSWKSEVSSTKWFVKYLLQHGFELFFLKTHFKTIL